MKPPMRTVSTDSGGRVDLILASGSPGRQSVLTQLSMPYLIDVPADTEGARDTRPDNTVSHRATTKARNVAPRHKKGLILAADTEVALDGRVLGKPANPEEAVEILLSLSGRSHEVLTAMTGILLPGSTEASVLVRTVVVFRDLSRPEILSYVKSGEPFGKAGAYAIQGGGVLFVSKIAGEYTNIMGFPVAGFLGLLRQLNLKVVGA